jgi:tRNA A37 methylthiotransferase MiaB
VPDPRDAFFVRVAEGCLGSCAYCAVPRARKRLRSKPLPEIERELRAGLAEGRRAIFVVGTDVGAWGRDLGLDLTALLDCVLGLPGDFRLNFFAVEPWWLIREPAAVARLASSPRVASLVVPVQSGSDRLLGAMRRQYTAAEVEDCLARIRAGNPGVVLRSHVIVGYPGETREDLAATGAHLARARFHFVEVHRFSARPGTPAAALAPTASPAEIDRRWRRMRRLERRLRLANYARLLPRALAGRV